MTLKKMYDGLKNSGLFRLSKQKRCSFETTQFFSELLNSGYSFSQCMEYLENEQMHELFQKTKDDLKKGKSYSQVFQDFFDLKVAVQMSSFLEFLSLKESLKLSLDLIEKKKESDKRLIQMTVYPVSMLCFSLVGVQFFCLVAMPALIRMMKGFDVSTWFAELSFHLLQIISGILIALIVLLIVFLWFMTRPRRLVFFVVLLYQMNLGFLIEKQISVAFAQFLLQCVKLGISTKDALALMKKCQHEPLTAFLAWHVEQPLLHGADFEQALSIRYLDSSLQRVMKTAILSGRSIELLNGYLKVEEIAREKRNKTFAVFVQTISYGFVSMMILLVYQILFLPLSMLERM